MSNESKEKSSWQKPPLGKSSTKAAYELEEGPPTASSERSEGMHTVTNDFKNGSKPENESSVNKLSIESSDETELLDKKGIDFYNQLIIDIETMYNFARRVGKYFDQDQEDLANKIAWLLAKKL